MKIDEFVTRHSDRILIAGKVFSVFLVFFWGAFFLEHLSWFTTGKGLPPVSVILSIIFHGTMLTGYIVFLFKCKYGSYVILVSAALFFFIYIPLTTAVFYFLISSVPAFLWSIICYAGLCVTKRQNQEGNNNPVNNLR
ncbi:MAG: hypothetical protein HUU43_16275 [Ignavibacteriaceae bacterium]|nr:hypothetical protein [Ignavibacteriaceae bacterium]